MKRRQSNGQEAKAAPPGLPRRLRQAREAAGKTVAECAKAIKKHRDTWYSWEAGTSQPSLHDGLNAAKFLGVSPFWLDTGIEP
ncbi:MAG: helix-turn-helix transcriptional regulator [Acidobacteriales bacterium]|nr:helix-turn-helix transcriptional regulator [Terriglobales bacterium]